MTRLEALERVAEAARALLNDVAGAWGCAEDELRQAIGNTNYNLIKHRAEWLQRGLDALPAPAAAAEGETVEVRAHVRFDVITRERYVIEGGGRIDGTDDDPPSGRAFATIRARVPLPRVPEVVGEVG